MSLTPFEFFATWLINPIPPSALWISEPACFRLFSWICNPCKTSDLATDVLLMPFGKVNYCFRPYLLFHRPIIIQLISFLFSGNQVWGTSWSWRWWEVVKTNFQSSLSEILVVYFNVNISNNQSLIKSREFSIKNININQLSPSILKHRMLKNIFSPLRDNLMNSKTYA